MHVITGEIMPARERENARERKNLKNRIAATYSIIAADPQSGEMGIGVQSHFFAVGAAVPWIEPGVGIVATQSVVNKQYGPDGLELLRSETSAEEVVTSLTGRDPGKDYRQLAVLSAVDVPLLGGKDMEGKFGTAGKTDAAASGRSSIAVFTGANCIREAGDLTGDIYSVQANMMANPGVPEAMARAFERNSGALAERILEALKAAEALGGDIRGKQSAALCTARLKSQGNPAEERPVDIRVDDHPEPLEELQRLLDLSTAYRSLDEGDSLLSAGNEKEAMAAYREALERAPGNDETMFWQAVALLGAGSEREATALLLPLVSRNRGWYELLGRLEESGLSHFPENALGRLKSVMDAESG